MNRITLLLATLIVTTAAFAGGLSTGSPQLQALGSAWKSTTSSLPQSHAKDFNIVYGGADVERSLPFTAHIVA